MVGVAQLVELRVVIPAVVGSSPIVHPSFARHADADPLRVAGLNFLTAGLCGPEFNHKPLIN